jgi:hypothetical protein
VPTSLQTCEPDIVAPNGRSVGEGIAPPRKARWRVDSNYRYITCGFYKARIQNVARILLSLIVIEGYPRNPDSQIVVANHVIRGHNVKVSLSFADQKSETALRRTIRPSRDYTNDIASQIVRKRLASPGLAQGVRDAQSRKPERKQKQKQQLYRKMRVRALQSRPHRKLAAAQKKPSLC